MTYYNLSFIDNTTGITQLWLGVNTNSNGFFAWAIIFSLYLLIFMVFTGAGYSFKDVFIGANFIMAIIAGLLWGFGLVDPWILGFAAGLLFTSIFIKIASGG